MAGWWRRFGGWRRAVLVLAAFAVAVILWERDRRAGDWSDEVVVATRSMLAGGTEATEDDPTRGFLRVEARRALAELEAPLDFEPVAMIDAGDAIGSIVVRGGRGGAVRLSWAGRPVSLVGVERLKDDESGTSNPMGDRP